MANKVSYVFIAQDKFSRVMREANRLMQVSKKQLSSAQMVAQRAGRALDALAKKAKNAGKQLRDAGKSFSMRVSAPAAAASALAISNYDKQAVALAKVENSIKSTGGAAGLTMKQLTDEATKLQEKTIFGDEKILNEATAQLLTFTNIASDEFLRTQRVALDLATMLDGDLKSASIQLGKALNDPVANLSALSRSGIQFSAEQKEVIKALAEGGRLADAQGVILKELERQYGGTAAAAAAAGSGPLKQLNNSFGDMTEEIGQLQMEMLKPLIETLKQGKKWFAELSPEIKKIIAGGLLLMVVVGPLLIGFGAILAILPLMATGFSVLATGAALLASPFLLIPAAIAAVVAGIVYAYNHFESFRMLVDAIAVGITTAFDSAVELVKGTIDTLTKAWDSVSDFLGLSGTVEVVSTMKNEAETAAATITPEIKMPAIKAAAMITPEIDMSAIKAAAMITPEIDMPTIKAAAATVPETLSPLRVESTNRTDVNVNLAAPQGVVESVKTRQQGTHNANVGVNMSLAGI